MTEIPGRARVVIIGGGVIGASVAYHLAQLGWTDVLLLEQGQLSCGTTWHAAGLVGQLRASENGTRLVQYSCELYERLEAETEQEVFRGIVGALGSGGDELARSGAQNGDGDQLRAGAAVQPGDTTLASLGGAHGSCGPLLHHPRHAALRMDLRFGMGICR